MMYIHTITRLWHKLYLLWLFSALEAWWASAKAWYYKTMILGETCPRYVVIASGVIFAQTVFIAVLIIVLNRRQQTEQALQESKKNLSLAQAVAHIGSWTYTPKTGALYWSDELFRIYGLHPDGTRVNLNDSIAMIHPKDKVFVEETFRKALEQGIPYEINYRITRPDGTERYIRGIGKAEKSREEKIISVFGTAQDITARKWTTAALQENEEKFKSIVNASNDVIVLTDENGQVSYVNDAIERALGYSTAECIDGRIVREIVHPSDLEKIQDGMKRLYAGVSEEVELLIRVKHKDGTYHWIESRIQNLLDNEHIRGALMVFRDITDKKEAEEVVKAHIAFLDNTMEQSPFAMWISDTTGTVLRTNRALREALDLTDAQIIGKYNVLKDDNLDAQGVISQVHAVFLEQQSAHFSIPWMGSRAGHADFESAHDLWIDVSMFPIVDEKGELKNVVCQWIDITERKQAEDALRTSEERYRTLARNIPNGAVMLFDHDLRYVVAEGTGLAAAGFSGQEMTGKTVWEVFSPEVCAAIESDYQAALAGQHTVNEVPFGENIYYTHTLPVQDTNSVIIGGMVLVQNITKRKRAEERLKQALAEKSTLLQELYHRTKNNMQIICALLDLQATYLDDEQAVNALEETKDRIYSMALVHQKLYESQDLSRINLREYVQDLTMFLIESYRILRGREILVFDMEDVWMMIDTAIPCGLILNELLSNALKYAFPNDRRGEIIVRLRREIDGTIELRVADNGVGVPPDFDFRRDGRLGMKNVFALGERQLRGQVHFQAQNGIVCQVRFKDSLDTDSV